MIIMIYMINMIISKAVNDLIMKAKVMKIDPHCRDNIFNKKGKIQRT